MIPLRVVDDHNLVPRQESLAEFDGIRGGHVRLLYGGTRTVTPNAPISPAGGTDIPDWWTLCPRIYEAGVTLLAIEGAYVWPRFGVIADHSGRVSRASHREAAYAYPDFIGMPRVQSLEGQATLDTDEAAIPEIGPCIVTMPWGGNSNYGHFVLDCLPAVRLALDTPSLSNHRFIFPPLRDWHRNHLRLTGLHDWDELDTPVARTPAVVYSDIMDHYLHGPGQPVVDLRERQLSAAGPASHPGVRLFLTRDGHGDRTFTNEAEIAMRLEEDLHFVSVDPATLDVEDQIRLFRGAAAIVGATGAAFANTLYAPPGCHVVELQPEFLRGVWVRNLSQLLGLRYSAYFVPAEHTSTPRVIGGVERLEIGQTFSANVDAFVAHVESTLTHP